MKETMTKDFQLFKKDDRTKDDVIHYRLYRISNEKGNTCYQIQCEFRDEDITCTIHAKNIRRAQAIYSKIVQGKVTPCTISEVLEDLCS